MKRKNSPSRRLLSITIVALSLFVIAALTVLQNNVSYSGLTRSAPFLGNKDSEPVYDQLVLSGAVTTGKKYLRVIKTPAGEAPLQVRESWEGISLPFSLMKGVIGRGMVSGTLRGPRDFYGVEKRVAIDILRKKDPEAAEWFANALFPERYILFEMEEVGR